MKLIQSKQNQLSKVSFKFVGDPQPPANLNKSKHDTDAFSNLRSDSITVVDDDYKLTSNHIYISKFSNSRLSLESMSIHLQNGNNSICNIQSSGPVFIQNAINCIFVISCHQARLHHIKDSTVIVENRDKGNPIIIENCTQLLINDVDVDDFNHPSKTTKSPNYNVLSSEEVLRIKQRIPTMELHNINQCTF